MKTARTETQSIALITTMALFGIANLVYLGAALWTTGGTAFFLPMIAVMTFYTLNAVRGALEALSTYRYDDAGVERRHPLRRERMRWSDVRDFRIRRSTGDASVFLSDGRGAELRLDFQLLGDRGADLFRLAFAKLQPLVDAKLEALHRQARTFPRRHVGFIPVAGSVQAGAGTIQAGRSPVIRLDEVREIAVKEIKKLTATQEYAVTSPRGKAQFLSFVDDSPLLLRYLRSVVPEDRWTLRRTSGVFLAKLNALILVPVMGFAALVALATQAESVGVRRALAVRSETATATVETTEPTARGKSRLFYSFDAGGERSFGTAVAGGRELQPGESLTVRYDPQQPWLNMPAPGQGLELPNIWLVLGPAIAMLVLSLPHAAATLAYSVPRDPFEEWILAGPAASPVYPIDLEPR